jgi:aerobic C4-dicarboxylate transport protein
MKSLGFLRHLWVQVLIGIAIGVGFGAYLHQPAAGHAWLDTPKTLDVLNHVATMFIDLIRMLIAPVIFCTVATGVAQMGDLKKFGRVGGKTLLYFEVISTLALVVGWAVAMLWHPGVGMHINPATLDTKSVASYIDKGVHAGSEGEQLLNIVYGIVPKTFVGAFAEGQLLQVLLLAMLTGFACARIPDLGPAAARAIDNVTRILFSIIHIIVKAAPVGAFAAMAFTIGKFGTSVLGNLGQLILAFYLTAAIFVVVVLGLIARLAGFSILRFLAYIREEILIVLGTSSSETVLPQLMEKLERLGAPKPIVGLVIPTGYSFNLDGTNIYMTLAMLFLAQAADIHLSGVQMFTLLTVAMVTSKGASGVTGAGFITLAATLTVIPDIPVASIAVIFGIDRFMSTCRALTNLIGNGVAALVVSRWERELDTNALQRELLAGPGVVEADRDREEVLEEEETV